MMSINSLINKGCTILNSPESAPDKRTIIVLGTARGGTSIAAGALFHLGVPMFAATPPVYEDIHLASAFEKSNKKRYREIIEKYDDEPVWAWKRPNSMGFLPKLVKEVRNPMFVVMVRDAFAVASRNELSMGYDILKSMDKALMQQQKILRFISRHSFPVMLCSVEKTKQYPENFIENLISFTGLTPTPAQTERAHNFIEPEPMEYIEASRINRSHGQIGGVKNGVLFGWAAWAYREKAVEVELIKNDEVIETVEAIEWREHGRDVANRRNGYCGYRFDLAKLNIQVEDILHVRVKGEVRDLNNSPYFVKPENLSQIDTKKGGNP